MTTLKNIGKSLYNSETSLGIHESESGYYNFFFRDQKVIWLKLDQPHLGSYLKPVWLKPVKSG